VTGERISSGLAVAVALGYGIAVGARGGVGAGFLVLMLALVPVGIIRFSDDLGSYTGPSGDGSINAATPGCLIRLVGWVILLFPLGAMLWRAIAR